MSYHLFSNFKMRGLALVNRIVVSPIGQFQSAVALACSNALRPAGLLSSAVRAIASRDAGRRFSQSPCI